MAPYAINNGGEIAGSVLVQAIGIDNHPAIYQNGQTTDHFSKARTGMYFQSEAVAIDQKGDLIINTWQKGGTDLSCLYHADTGNAKNLTSLPGGANFIAGALNNNGQAVGNGFL